MEVWLIILFLIMYMVLEFVASFSFNFKIKMINRNKYTHAAALGALSTVIFTFLTAFASFVATIGNGSLSTDMWWFILAAAFMMAIGNVLATILIKPFENYLKKRQTRKEEIK